MSESLHTDLILTALSRTVAICQPPPGLLVHADRGSQYPREAFTTFLDPTQAVASLSRPGNPYDNALAESGWSTLKTELLPRGAWCQRARAVLAKRLGARQQRNQYLALSLNQAGLFAYTLEERLEYTGSNNYETSTRQVLYDLRTGQQLSLLGQLRPGGQRRLQQLLTRQALADTVGASRRDFWRPDAGAMPFPTAGFAVTPEGLVANYGLSEADLNPYLYSQILAWDGLRPLLRPASPLRRLLKVPEKQQAYNRSR